MLRRIAALLLALAGLADRAALRPRYVRYLVLWVLRSAEDVAQDYVARLAGASFPSQPPPILLEGGPAAAKRLALSFRSLAAALAVLVAEAAASRQTEAPVPGVAVGASAARGDWTGLEQRLDSS